MRRILVFIGLLSICYLLPAQVKQEPVNIDIITKKLEKINKKLQGKIFKFQRKLEKKLQKKYPDLSRLQMDSLVSSERKADLPDSLKNNLAKFCTGCPTLAGLKKELQEKTNLTPPNLDIGKDLNISIKELDKLQAMYQKLQLPDLNKFKDVDLKSMALDQSPLSGGDLKGIEGKAGDLKGKSGDLKSLALAKSPLSAGDLKKLTDNTGDLSSLLDEYKKEFEGWEGELLAKVTNLEEIKLLQEQQKKLEEYKPLPEGYRSKIDQFQTNDFVKTQLEKKAEELKKMGGETLQKKFDDALAKVTKAKKKFPDLESLKDAPKRPPNPLEGQPFNKRLRLGGNLQVNRQAPTSIDFSAKLGYLLNPKAQIGIGMAYRFSTGTNFSSFALNDELFSAKLFFDHFIYKSFYLQSVLEWNRTELKDKTDISLGTHWVQSGFVGLGKEFAISKKLKGSMSVLYNFLHDEKSPYKKPFVFRVGFRL